jgi:hypothetical protein
LAKFEFVLATQGGIMLTEKQNYLMVLAGEQPEWVPICGPNFGAKTPEPSHFFEPPLLNPHRAYPPGMDLRGRNIKDIWGVSYVVSESTDFALTPDTSNFILPLDKLPHWRDIIKAPNLSDVNWEKLITQQISDSKIDRKQTAVAYALHFGYFQHLMSFMGFEDGLIAFYEYPDEVHELLHYLSDFYMKITDLVIDYYQPDLLTFMDDTASESAPFISAEMYREFILPHHEKFAKRGRERGLPMTMHNCGKCESFLDMLVGIGINSWDPAQTVNDLDAIKARYGNHLVLCGGWDERERLLLPLEPEGGISKNASNQDFLSEAELRQSVRNTIDRLAPGGGYCWTAMVLERAGDTSNHRKNLIISNEAQISGRSFYR